MCARCLCQQTYANVFWNLTPAHANTAQIICLHVISNCSSFMQLFAFTESPCLDVGSKAHGMQRSQIWLQCVLFLLLGSILSDQNYECDQTRHLLIVRMLWIKGTMWISLLILCIIHHYAIDVYIFWYQLKVRFYEYSLIKFSISLARKHYQCLYHLPTMRPF